MPLSLNEIKKRAVAFSKEWENETSEDAEAKSFWDGFFNVFGIPRRRVATFEESVKKIDDSHGYIDLLWKGKLLIEHKSRGKSLDKAYKQAKDYFPGLKDAELPQYILVCDFQHFRLYDLDTNEHYDFTLNKLVDHIRRFDFISGYTQHRIREQDPINIDAAQMMGKLHDKLKVNGYEGHKLELYLVRLVFCLFADDTGIFEPGIFYDFLDRTKEDGSDLARSITELFEILNTPNEKRLRNLDESIAAFPYINGKLFEEPLSTASFDSEMREILLDSCGLNWSYISPAIFGSLFQSVMDEKARRNLGAHYTSEKNILKLIKPLFLDELYEEFNKVKGNSKQLDTFHNKLAGLRFIDPACGCGNFLIVAYRELRLLEIEVLKAKFNFQGALNIESYININVDQFYGIEYEEFPAQIAQVAMWLIDHQMNQMVSEAFGEYYVRLPLRKSATIKHGNALRIEWQSLLQERQQYNYILGNPPFIGHQWRNEEQMRDMDAVFGDAKRAGRLDYVAAWYLLAAKYMNQHNTGSIKTKTAFVSTNSIAQGEQVSILWGELFNKYHIKIHFAHRTFKWTNEAKGNAAVHVVIVGYSNFDIARKILYDYPNIKGEPIETSVNNINAYLIEGKDVFIESRSTSIHDYPSMFKGSQPTDGGFLILDPGERDELLKNEPNASQWIKPFIGGVELINNKVRYCLWLKECPPDKLRNMPYVMERLKEVTNARLKSSTASVREFAKYPSLFTQDRQPNSDYLAVPRVSSENRKFIPIAFLSSDIIAHEKLLIIPNANLFLFGMLNSTLHMVWTKYVCGRLKSDYSYSPSIYNNFPFPPNPSEKQKEAVEKAAQAVLDARVQFPDSSLADLYDPNTMPPVLVKAHQQLDKAVDLCYRPQPFTSETKRIEYLFELYDKYTANLFTKETKPKKKK